MERLDSCELCAAAILRVTLVVTGTTPMALYACVGSVSKLDGASKLLLLNIEYTYPDTGCRKTKALLPKRAALELKTNLLCRLKTVTVTA